MRKPMMAGNWKMNKTPAEAAVLAQEILDRVGTVAGVDRVVCPPFVALAHVAKTLTGSDIAVGAQTMHWETAGAFTGEISPAMLAGLASHVILGHSERRQLFGENDEGVNRKARAALAHGLTPIVCVGESLEQNEAGATASIVGAQVEAALAGIDANGVAGLIIAYEPIWAIGTGRAATAAQAQEICGGVVRGAVARLYGAGAAKQVRILYGGSTNPDNIGEIMQQPDIDGALIGGASLKADTFAAMVQTTAQVYAPS